VKQNIRFSEIFNELRTLVYGAMRFRWTGMAFIWALCVSGWLWVMALPNIYEATSRMFIDTSSTLSELLVLDVVKMDTLAEAKIMVKALTSRPNLEEIAVRTGILVGGEPVSEVESTILNLERKLDISLDTSQVLKVAYRNSNPEIALSVTSKIVDTFIEGLLVVNRGDSDVAQEFLEEQLKEYEELLSNAESRLAEFKKNNIGLMPGERGDYFARSQQEQEILNSLEFQLRLARQRQAELNRQISGETPVFGLAMPVENTSSVDPVVARQIREFEQELAVLRIQYTDSHPDIVRINAVLEDLREQQIRQKEEQTGMVGGQGSSLEENPVYQSMKIQLNTAELKVIELQTKVADQARLVKDLRAKIDVIPEVEANLTRLNRNYEVNKAQYDALLRRLETARMTERAEQSKTQYDFRIIDPPVVSSSPVGPPRILLMTAVLFLSIGAGIALAIFLSFTRPVFFSTRVLEQRFGIPVLGAVRYVNSEAEIASARLNVISFTVSCVAVLGCYALVVVFNQAGANLIGNLLVFVGS
jgi:polysaccharide chain length determinant protein (PEP-CTERM system associated)